MATTRCARRAPPSRSTSRVATVARAGETFGAHIGIALGDVLAGHVGSASHAAYTVTGEAATLAARLMEAAPPGETWVDDAIAERDRAEVPCRSAAVARR